jgi:hypothetical protein
MRIANGEWRGADIYIDNERDLLQPPKSIYFCNFQFPYPKVIFINCVINNPLTALSPLREEGYGGNAQNKALHLVDPSDPQERDLKWMSESGVDPGPIDTSWVMLYNLVLDFCHLPVFCFARNTDITYIPPQMSRNLLTIDEWRHFQSLCDELDVDLKDDKFLTEMVNLKRHDIFSVDGYLAKLAERDERFLKEHRDLMREIKGV